MTDLRGLAARETQPSPVPSQEELISRIGMLAHPYAFELGVDPLLAALLVRYVATIASGLIREAQIAQLRAQTVIVRDERG